MMANPFDEQFDIGPLAESEAEPAEEPVYSAWAAQLDFGFLDDVHVLAVPNALEDAASAAPSTAGPDDDEARGEVLSCNRFLKPLTGCSPEI